MEEPLKKKKKKRKKRKYGKNYYSYATSKARENLLSKAKVAVTNTMKYPEIKEPIFQWGYAESSILLGKSLYETAEQTLDDQSNRYAELEWLTHEVGVKHKTGRKIYIAHLKLARIVIPVNNKEYRVSLGLNGRRTKGGFRWLDQARLFYQNALKSPGILALFLTVGLTEAKLKSGVEAMEEIEQADLDQENMKGLAQEATIKLNEAFEALSIWLSGFHQVCKMVFPSGPARQTLERLGIPAITSPNRKKKN